MCGPSDGKEVKDFFGSPGARVGVGSARLRPLAIFGVGCTAAGPNLETGQLSRQYKAEISLNVTLNHNQQQQQPIQSDNVVFWTHLNWLLSFGPI